MALDSAALQCNRNNSNVTVMLGLRGRGRRPALVLVIGVVILPCSTVGLSTSARADGITDQQHQIQQLAADLNALNDRISRIDENYGAELDTKNALDAAIAVGEAELTTEQAQLDQLNGVMTDIAVNRFVGNKDHSLSPLFSSAAVYSDAQQFDALSNIAFDSGASNADDLQSLVLRVHADAAQLQRQRTSANTLIATLAQQKSAGQALIATYTAKHAAATARYGELVQQEADRQAAIKAQQAARQAAEQEARQAAKAVAAPRRPPHRTSHATSRATPNTSPNTSRYVSRYVKAGRTGDATRWGPSAPATVARRWSAGGASPVPAARLGQGGHRGRRGEERARGAVPGVRGVAVDRLRLLGAHDVGVGAGRRVHPAPVAPAVQHQPRTCAKVDRPSPATSCSSTHRSATWASTSATAR